MTDRDLFYCTDFNCDGHARSNDRCIDPESGYPVGPVSYCDRVLGEVHTAADHDACERRRIEALRAKPKAVVSGNSMRIFRLDPEGNPIGEPVELAGPVSFDVPFGSADDAVLIEDKAGGFHNLTLDFTLNEVSPELLALLTGQGTPPEELTLVLPRRPWWRKVIDRIRRWQWTIIGTLVLCGLGVFGAWWLAFLWGRLTR